MFECADLVDPSEAPAGVVIHPTAIVARTAELGQGVVIGPRAVIGPKARLGDGVKIGTGAVIDGVTTIGRETYVYPYATLGSAPQDLKYAGEPTRLEVGEKNRIREYANLSVGTVGGGGLTQVGSSNLIMAYTHIAHDCHIGDHCIFANGVQLAGHVTVGDRVVFGGMSGGHQFCRFGEYAMVGAGAIVVQDVVPYSMVQGDRATIHGLNVVGLRRAGLTGERMAAIKAMFRLLLKENLTLEEATARIRQEVAATAERERFLAFLAGSTRGICR